jgi:ribonuclease E
MEDEDNGDDHPDAEADAPEDFAEITGEEPGENREEEPAETDSDDGEEPRGEKRIVETSTSVETLGGDEADDAARNRSQLLRHYKIQEVIKRRQVMLVQVSKEERGNKGAALTTYLSLAGRYCVLMPNTARGGGISRKISNPSDRRRLKKIVSELEIPEGMAVIVRTAGSQRSKAEIRRDYDYLLRLWNDIREETLQSTAPALIHEEGNLIKRSIRDLYTRDMDDIHVEGEEGYKAAKAFMKSLMPSHARKVQLYKDETIPLFHRYQVENQLDAIHEATVGLRSGGYIVINQTEALVAIDVNSGKATRERHIEETALKTNTEAAEEVARQLRLRDLAGLIVIDFIDMEENRHNRQVENKLKEAMKSDRARIQLGRISPFGLLEMSRQRLRPSLFESSTRVCPRCAGSGHIRATDTSALHVIRALEDEGIKRGPGEIHVALPGSVALFLLNRMRKRLAELEDRYGFRVEVTSDDGLVEPDYRLERRSSRLPESEEVGAAPQPEPATAPAAADEEETGKKRRGRRRRKKPDLAEQTAESPAEVAAATEDDADDETEAPEAEAAVAVGEDEAETKPKKRRRRGKRGGRRRSKRSQEMGQETGQEAGESDQAEPHTDMGGEAPAPSREEAPSDALPAEEAPAEESMSEEIPARDTQAEAEGEKPKPKRRSRRKPAAKKKAEAEAPGEEQAEAASATDVESEEKAPAKPASKRPARTRKKTEAAADAGTQPSKSEAPEAAPAESGAAKPDKPKRARRSPKSRSGDSKAAAETKEPTVGASQESAESESVERQPAGNGPAAEPPAEPKTPRDEREGTSSEPGEQPRKRGWWNLLGN